MYSLLTIFALSFFTLVASSANTYHAIYISVTEIELHHSELSTVSIKIFSDDLKAAIQNFSGKSTTEPDATFIDQNKEAVSSYINKYFQLSLNNKKVTLEYIDHTLEGDAYFINFGFRMNAPISPLSIKAEYLMELFPTQQNVVKINFENEQRFLKFDSSTDTQSVNFD
ncbi:DUF6702 family protein [Fulvivirga lutimaris]|uniref:DUF6702 family protein n=1 Tax=Fulvivirga lutimaris TaxID=1819566 RepID=UPI0012BD0E83|nr:DUF6702 family protein [Fulvivirga lutimaris]MTI38130.1 hypothetical protein [Fulvivirga lutimaris]